MGYQSRGLGRSDDECSFHSDLSHCGYKDPGTHLEVIPPSPKYAIATVILSN